MFFRLFQQTASAVSGHPAGVPGRVLSGFTPARVYDSVSLTVFLPALLEFSQPRL
jgi:hypothetical protein